MELKTALQLERPVYIFIDRSVLSEFQTFLENSGNNEIKYHYVDDQKVFHFIKEIEALPKNNPIVQFENTTDIIIYLREQWAGLFKNLLQEQSREKEIRLFQQMESTAKTLDQLVSYLSQQRDGAIESILLSNHPAFNMLAKLARAPYRIFFTNNQEMATWLEARSYEKSDPDSAKLEKFEEWVRTTKNHVYVIYIYNGIFDAKGKLKVYTAEDWDKNWIHGETIKNEKSSDDDIPF
jgi:hypothetical protein